MADNIKDIRELLEKIVLELKKANVIGKDTNTMMFVNEMIEYLNKNGIRFSADDLNTKEVEQSLRFMCVVKLHPELKNSTELKKQLKMVFSLLLKLTPEEKAKKEVDKELDLIIDKLMEKLSDKNELSADKTREEICLDELKQRLNSPSLMRNDPNPGALDPLGIILNQALDAIRLGENQIEDALERVEQYLGEIENCLDEKFEQHFRPSPFSMSMRPPGYR